MKVFCDLVYNGKELMKIVGIRKEEVELEGDFSGGTHAVTQKDWFPLNTIFRLKSICDNKDFQGNCPLHNIHCKSPDCEYYVDNLGNKI